MVRSNQVEKTKVLHMNSQTRNESRQHEDEEALLSQTRGLVGGEKECGLNFVSVLGCNKYCTTRHTSIKVTKSIDQLEPRLEVAGFINGRQAESGPVLLGTLRAS